MEEPLRQGFSVCIALSFNIIYISHQFLCNDQNMRIDSWNPRVLPISRNNNPDLHLTYNSVAIALRKFEGKITSLENEDSLSYQLCLQQVSPQQYSAWEDKGSFRMAGQSELSVYCCTR